MLSKVKKLEHREVKTLTLGHTATKWMRQELNLGMSKPSASHISP
jgi:hypothetical protein